MQFARYLAAGVANTVFGYATFAFFTWLLRDTVPRSYLAATVLASVLNITFSYLSLKKFVFLTSGNYMREWSRCLLVYGVCTLLSLALLPAIVDAIAAAAPGSTFAPYLGGAVTTAISAVTGFFMHRRFSFSLR